MMPLPWLIIFSFIFLCLSSVSLYFSFFSVDSDVSSRCFKSSGYTFPW